jgi:Uma2 family endonuclease
MSTLTTPTSVAPLAPPLQSEESDRYEIVDGQHVALPPMSAYASVIASRLFGELAIWLKNQELGKAVVEVLFKLPINRSRQPDVTFVSYERWPKDKHIPESDKAWEVVPDLAVEVISPTDYAEDLLARIDEFFRAGVRLVWVVYPRRRIIHVYHSLTQTRGLTGQDELDGGEVVPGFRLPLEVLFA